MPGFNEVLKLRDELVKHIDEAGPTVEEKVEAVRQFREKLREDINRDKQRAHMGGSWPEGKGGR